MSRGFSYNSQYHATANQKPKLNVTGTNPFGDSSETEGGEDARNPFRSSSSSTPSSPRPPVKGHQRAASGGGLNPFGSSTSSSSHNPFGSSRSASSQNLGSLNSLNPFGSEGSLPRNALYNSSSVESLPKRTSTLTSISPNHRLSVESIASTPVTSPVSNNITDLRKVQSVDSGLYIDNGRQSVSSLDSSFYSSSIAESSRAESSRAESLHAESLRADSSRPESPVPELQRERHQSNMTSILNDPARRSKNYDADMFTKTWGSYFVPTPVLPSKNLPPEVRPEHFIPYLKYLLGPYKTVRAKEKEMAAISRARKKSGEHVDIDPIFLKPDFRLSDPETFEYVLPQSQFESQIQVEKDRKTFVGNAGLPQRSTKLLQEKLSHCLDKVEMKLGEQVDIKSHKFFETIHSQERLSEDAKYIKSDIQNLRSQLSAVDTGLNKQSLQILHLHRLRERYKQCHEKLVLMSTVKQAQPTIQLLLSQSDFVGALDLITTTQEVLHDDLNGIKSFRHLDVQLCEMERMIYNMIEADFVKFTLSTLTIDDKTFSEIEDDTDRIICVLFGLLRRKNVNFLQTYKSEANTMTKAKIKQIIAEQLYDVNFEGDLKLDEQIRSLPPVTAVMLIEKVFEGITKLLTKMGITNKLIKCVITSAANKPLPEELLETFSDHAKATLNSQKDPEVSSLLSDIDYTRMMAESNDVLVTSCEIAQSQCIKILTLRQQRNSAVNERLDHNNHIKLSRLVESFAVTCEQLTNRSSHPIRASLVGQSRELVKQFHQERLTNIKLLLETERWVAADVPADFQRMVDNIVKNCSPSEVVARPTYTANDPPRSSLSFSGKRYIVTSTLLIVIKILIEYCQCVVDIPVMSKDILTKTVENLKHFNEGTCHLVLKAGAIKNIGLKTITAKHLGIASQSLSVVLQLLPWVRNIFTAHLPKTQHLLLDQINNLETDIQDHMNQIFSKLINIMGDVYRSSLHNWQPKPPTPSHSITVVTRQTIKLHEALASLLQPSEIQLVFRGVFCLFRKYFEEQLTRHGLMNCGSNPKRHGIVGAELSHFIDSVSYLECVGDSDDIFHDIGTR